MNFVSDENKSTTHAFARKLVYEYLATVYDSACHRIYFAWPFTKAIEERKADLAVVTFPDLDTVVWVEVQDTPLSKEQWENKLDIKCSFERLFVVLTDKTIKELTAVDHILKTKNVRFEIFYADVKHERLFVYKDRRLQTVRERKVNEKNITLEDFY